MDFSEKWQTSLVKLKVALLYHIKEPTQKSNAVLDNEIASFTTFVTAYEAVLNNMVTAHRLVDCWNAFVLSVQNSEGGNSNIAFEVNNLLKSIDDAIVDSVTKSKTITLQMLAQDIDKLQKEILFAGTESLEIEKSIKEIEGAKNAANEGQGEKALTHLAKTGKWVLDVAEKIGLAVVTAAIKSSLGL